MGSKGPCVELVVGSLGTVGSSNYVGRTDLTPRCVVGVRILDAFCGI